MPLVKALGEACDGDAGRYVHWGATTQDIVDSGLVLQIRDGLALIESDLDAIVRRLTELARQYRDTPMAGRSHLQHALPITFGFKCAVWLSAMQRHRRRLESLRGEVLVVQFGGAVGTLASLGEDGIARARGAGRGARSGGAGHRLACRAATGSPSSPASSGC